MEPISLVAQAVPGIIKGIGSLFGGGKRRREERRVKFILVRQYMML